MSKNTALEHLSCGGNQLTVLDVSKNSALEYFYCGSNQLKELDVSKNPALIWLYCYNNQLTGLNVSKNSVLEDLFCRNNQLTALDVSNNTALQSLLCDGNQLTALDVSKNTALEYLYCNYNHMASSANVIGWSGLGLVINSPSNLDDGTFRFYPQYEPAELTYAQAFPDANFRHAILSLSKLNGRTDSSTLTDGDKTIIANITHLDVSYRNIKSLKGVEYFTGLETLYCNNNQLTTLDVSKNTALIRLYCGESQLAVLDVSNNTALEDLLCYYNQLTVLDVSKNTALKTLDCDGNQLTELDVSNNSALNKFSCGGNQLTVLDVSKNTALIDFSCYDNKLTVLDVSKNTALIDFSCFYNQLTALDVSNNTALEFLLCDGNQLPTLDVSNNTALESLTCDGNQLTALDVSNNTALEILGCDFNQLPTLDVSNNTALGTLFCRVNKLTSLDISNNTALEMLLCEGNQLTDLDVSKNMALETLWCGDNQLTVLDVSNNTALITLNCSINQLAALDLSKNSSLENLDCGWNQLTALNVSKNSALKYIECSSNQLTTLDVAKNTVLKTLLCYDNYMASPASVIGWSGLGLVINSPSNQESGTFHFYPQNTPAPPTTSSIIGTVTLNNQPVAVNVELWNGNTKLKNVTSAADGSFSFTDLPTGVKYTVKIPAGSTWQAFSQDCDLTASDITLQVTLTAPVPPTTSTASISGTVTLSNQSVAVNVELWNGNTKLKNTTSAADGSFSFTDLPIGIKYTVKIPAGSTWQTFSQDCELAASDITLQITLTAPAAGGGGLGVGGGGGGGGSSGAVVPVTTKPSITTGTAVNTSAPAVSAGTDIIAASKANGIAALASFSDASRIAPWAATFFERLIKEGIISGKGDGTLDPKGYVTRAEFTKMIVLAMDIKAGSEILSFEDVKETAWYKEYVDLASSNGIVQGVSKSNFAPNANITRQDLCTIVYRALTHVNAKLPDAEALSFPDADAIGSYAGDAVAALKQLGIISGRDDGRFDPAALATREETAKIICGVMDSQSISAS